VCYPPRYQLFGAPVLLPVVLAQGG
jgi:hypothetical protein